MKKQEHKVSVIIPCYNAATHIEKCIESLAKQTFDDFCAIFVDDHSNDSTVSVINDVAGHLGIEYKIIRNEINSGPGRSRANGIAAADTRWICFCDSDDWYDESFLERQLAGVEQSDAEIGICGYRVVGDRGSSEHSPLSNAKTLLPTDALQLDVDSLCVLIVDKYLLQTVEMPDIRNGEDMCVVPALISRANQCYVSPRCMYNYLRRTDSASEMPSLGTVDSLLESFSVLRKSMPESFSCELEFIGIKNCIYAVFITLFAVGYYPQKASEILDWFESLYPEWKSNKWISGLPFYKRLVINLVGRKRFAALRIVALLRSLTK